MAKYEPSGRDQISYSREVPDRSPEEELRARQIAVSMGQDRTAPRVLTDVPDRNESYMESFIETKSMSVEDALSRGFVRKVEEMIAKSDYHMDPGDSFSVEISGKNLTVTRSDTRTEITVDGVPAADPRVQEYITRNQMEINERIRQAIIREERERKMRNIQRAIAARETRRQEIRTQIDHNKREYGKQMAQKKNASKEEYER